MNHFVVVLILLLAGVLAAQDGMNCGESDYQCKVAYYTKAISNDPGNMELYYSRGIAYELNGQYDPALADFDKYISMRPSKPEYLADGYTSKGNVYRLMNKFPLAIREYTTALQLNAKSHSARLNRGISYYRNSDFPNALKDYAYLLQQDARDPEAYYNRSLLYIDQKNYRLAIADLDKYVSLDVTSNTYLADGFRMRGLARFRSGDANGSLADLNKSIGLDPNNPKAYTARAEVYRKLGKPDLAADDEQKARDLGGN